MKHDAIHHPKMKCLARLLGVSIREAVGTVEMLIAWTGQYCPDGAIGRFSNQEIADAVQWPEDDADRLVDAIVESRFFDTHHHHRLVVHDWHEHLSEWIIKKLERSGTPCATGPIFRRSGELRVPMWADDDIAADNGCQQQTTAANGCLPNLTKPNLTQPMDPPYTPPPGGADTGGNSATDKALFDGTADTPEPRRRKKATAGPEVDAIYEAYPRPGGRQAGLRAIQAALRRLNAKEDKAPPDHDGVWPPDDAAGWLLERTEHYARVRSDLDKGKHPHASTWFNQARYCDDETEWRRNWSDTNGGTGGAGDDWRARKAAREFPSTRTTPVPEL